MSLNKLIEELSTIALTEYDAETRFSGKTPSILNASRLTI
jgi:hypothetical protein